MQDKKLIVDNNLESLKMHFKVDSDGELAEKLDTSYRAIAQWRWKNKIPKWVLRKYDQVISGVRSNAVGVQEQVVVENQPIHITKGEEPVDASYIINLQKDKIETQAIEIKTLKKELKQKNNISCNHTFESTDYDIITYQTYVIDNKTPYKYFSSYEIVRWEAFCKKLGYVGQEAVELHNYIQAINTDSLDDYTGKKFYWIACPKNLDILDWKYTERFFKNARLKQFINAVEIHTVNYIHKDGYHIPASMTVMYDMKGDSSVSKIKFLDTSN